MHWEPPSICEFHNSFDKIKVILSVDARSNAYWFRNPVQEDFDL